MAVVDVDADAGDEALDDVLDDICAADDGRYGKEA